MGPHVIFSLTDGDLISKQNGGKQILSKKNKLWGGGGDERSLAKDQNPIDFFASFPQNISMMIFPLCKLKQTKDTLTCRTHHN